MLTTKSANVTLTLNGGISNEYRKTKIMCALLQV